MPVVVARGFMINQISLVHYLDYKASGTITSMTLGTDGDTITITSKQFDPQTGTQLADLITTWSLTDITNQKSYIDAQSTIFASVISDVGAAH
jgi:hypothetical protein